MRRRTAISLGITSILAGCLGARGPQPRPWLAWIWLQNDREEEYDVDVVVEEDGAVVFAETYRVGATPEAANLTVEDPVDGPGRYVVRATMDGETREVAIADFVDGDERCVGVRFSLRNDGSITDWTKSMQQC